jgi:putative transcriptional regulator
MPAPPAKGHIIVATPALEDPNFYRTVVFLLAADSDGALGVVLNRPSDTSVDDIVPHWGLHVSSPQVLFAGGPVQPNAAICVGRVSASQSGSAGTATTATGSPSGSGYEGLSGLGSGSGKSKRDPEEDDFGLGDLEETEGNGYSPLIGSLGTVDLNRGPEDIPVVFTGLRVFTGYSGWGPGQLEDEIEAGGWFVLEGQEADVLSPEPDRLWERVLRRQGGWLAVMARHPADASLN